jgi:hypothetical protein
MKLLEYTQKIVGLPYCPGGMNPGTGLGCFTIVYNWLKIHMPGLPDEYHGYTLTNRRKHYDADPEAANKMMLRFFDEHLEPIAPAFAFVGDILWSSITVDGPACAGAPAGRKEHFAAGIHAGNGQVLGATPLRGVILLPLRAYKIHRAWKIPGDRV